MLRAYDVGLKPTAAAALPQVPSVQRGAAQLQRAVRRHAGHLLLGGRLAQVCAMNQKRHRTLQYDVGLLICSLLMDKVYCKPSQ